MIIEFRVFWWYLLMRDYNLFLILSLYSLNISLGFYIVLNVLLVLRKYMNILFFCFKLCIIVFWRLNDVVR